MNNWFPQQEYKTYNINMLILFHFIFIFTLMILRTWIYFKLRTNINPTLDGYQNILFAFFFLKKKKRKLKMCFHPTPRHTFFFFKYHFIQRLKWVMYFDAFLMPLVPVLEYLSIDLDMLPYKTVLSNQVGFPFYFMICIFFLNISNFDWNMTIFIRKQSIKFPTNIKKSEENDIRCWFQNIFESTEKDSQQSYWYLYFSTRTDVPAHFLKQLEIIFSIICCIICWLASCWACIITAWRCSGESCDNAPAAFSILL